jgi:chromosome partitioning protein
MWPGMVLTFIGQKGGSGKSTLAHSVAWELQARLGPVLLVDTDPQGTCATAYQVAEEAGLSPPLTRTATARDLLRPERFKGLGDFQAIIIDTPGRSGDIQEAALLVSDIAIIPVAQGGADTWALARTLETLSLARRGRPELKAAFLINKLRLRTRLGQGMRQSLEPVGLPILRTEVASRLAWEEALTAGQGVAAYAPSSPAAQDLRSVVRELTQLVRKEKQRHAEKRAPNSHPRRQGK